MRPIDADAYANELAKGSIVPDDLYEMGIMAGVDYARKKLADVPTLTLAALRPKGRWEEYEWRLDIAHSSSLVFVTTAAQICEEVERMREILFRGKRLDNGEWVEGYYLHLGPVASERAYMIPSYASALYTYEVDPTTVGQFTGLLDKNGKRIFEGDIVRLFFIDAEEVGEIVWDEERCRVAYMSPDVEIYGVDGTVEIEIIGNIHDNPELLEVTPDE